MEERRKLKRRVRLFKAEDVIYMTLGCEPRHREWEDVDIDEKGYRLSIRSGVAEEPVTATYSATWEKVAEELGFDVCEYVINRDDAKCVLMYDEE